MLFLTGATREGRFVTLHVRGFSEGGRSGFVDGEGIFLVERRADDPNNPGIVNMHVTQQVGVVHIMDGVLRFEYTDEAFKALINYQDGTGYSTLDGAPWTAARTNYGTTEGVLQPADPGLAMYISANTPFRQIDLPSVLRAAVPFGPQRPDHQDQQPARSFGPKR